MGTTTTDMNVGDGRGTPGLDVTGTGPEVGAARGVATNPEVAVGPEVGAGRTVQEDGPGREVGAGRRVGEDGLARDLGAGGRLPRLERWAEGRGVVTAMAVGLLAGAGWGIVARAWMRLITEHPEFTWSGTLFIIGAPAIIGAVVALAHVAMARRWRAATLLRVPAVAVHVLVAAGAGIVLLPTIVMGSIALTRRTFGLTTRVVLALLVVGLGLPMGLGDGDSGLAIVLVGGGVTIAVLILSGWRTGWMLAGMALLPVVVVSGSMFTLDISLLRALPGALAYPVLVAVPTLSAASVVRPREAATVVERGAVAGAVSGEVVSGQVA